MRVEHPGVVLHGAIEAKGWSLRFFGRLSGLEASRVSEICRGVRNITASSALRLETVFDKPAIEWLELQIRWDLQEARKKR